MDVPLDGAHEHLAETLDLRHLGHLGLDDFRDLGQHLASQYQFGQKVGALLVALADDVHGLPGRVQDRHGLRTTFYHLSD